MIMGESLAGGFRHLLFLPFPGEDEPNLTMIFFKSFVQVSSSHVGVFWTAGSMLVPLVDSILISNREDLAKML